MSLIQFLLIVAVVGITVVTVRSLPGEKSLAAKRIFALLFVAVAVTAIMFPNFLTVIAHSIGVGRGTDLLLYLFIIAFMLFAATVIRAKARSDARVTRLARAVSLMEARAEEDLSERKSLN